MPIQSGYCSNLPYNTTTYPNMLGQTSIDQVDLVIDTVKAVVDSKCHPLAYELLCQTVQPVCYNDNIVRPCAAFCHEFMEACEVRPAAVWSGLITTVVQGYIPAGLLDGLRCAALPTEADGPGACISKPGCVGALKEEGHEDRFVASWLWGGGKPVNCAGFVTGRWTAPTSRTSCTVTIARLNSSTAGRAGNVSPSSECATAFPTVITARTSAAAVSPELCSISRRYSDFPIYL